MDNIGYYIGHSTDETVRHKASSGGIGTALTKYLLSTDDYETAVTYFFDSNEAMYKPLLIHSADDVIIKGSVYHDIDIARFVQNNINEIRGGFVVTCPPCQVSAVRQICKKNNIKLFAISYCCSGQITIEGTWKYYELLGIDKKDVIDMQYRGNGWPSGIQIKLKDGKTIFRENYTEPWTTLHRSWLYRPQKCFFCKRDTGRNADISLADPWIDEYKSNDSIGNTMFLVFSENGKRIIDRMHNLELISYVTSNYDEYAIAQAPNIHKELMVREHSAYLKRLHALISNDHYRKWATSSLSSMKRHLKFMAMLRRVESKQTIYMSIKNFIRKIKNRIRRMYYSKRMNTCGQDFYVGRATINNPQCIYLGKGVCIGDDTFLGPITRYAGVAYNPKIVIGDGTSVGKHCSIAAIDRVEIGKHVLFAGYVHITDHSHGYEDIDRPVAPQRLISKGSVTIEDDCWLGFSSEILSGVHIGKHCVVAARAVVTKDVPPYSIVAGNPARIVKQYNFETKKWEKLTKKSM